MKTKLFWILTAASLVVVAVVGVPQVRGARQQSNFQNIQVLTDMSDGDIQRLMMSWAQQLGGVTCLECHVQGDFASDDNPQKTIARSMARMVMSLNEEFFSSDQLSGLERQADCYLCHKGALEIPPM